MPLSLIKSIFKWTPKDPVLIEHIKKTDEKRMVIDEKLSDLTKASLDSEDGWMLKWVATKDPECVLKVVADCMEKENSKGN